MADASSASHSKAADHLREAAKRTMIRKQAPIPRQSSNTTLNGTFPANHSSPRPPSSGSPSPGKLHPKGPRNNSLTLNYGDLNDSPILDNHNLSGGPKQGTVRKQQPQRMSVTRARAEAAKGDEAEEGEISDEEIRAKREVEESTIIPSVPIKAEPIPVAATASLAVSIPEKATSTDADLSALDADIKPNLIQRIAAKPVHAPAIVPVPRRVSGAMQPPRPQMNVHREPAPISPVASVLATQGLPTARKLRTEYPIPIPPTLNTHSFDNFSQKISLDTDMLNGTGQDYDDDAMRELSPKTTQMNQEVFTQLLRLGVDETHCRPGLSMTFQQFNDAKELILDLLGFGMTPEHIADIGLNRRLLIYCLRELKIRLPANVPVDDIVLFDPPFDPSLEQRPKEDDSEQCSAPQSPLNTSDRVQSPESMETSPIDALIVEKISDSSTETHPSPPPEPALTESSLPPLHPSLPLPPSKLNVHAEPFLPAKPPPQTTGPSLFNMALSHQQIPPMPTHEPLGIAALPPRPSFSLDAPSSRRSTAGSSSAETVAPVIPIPPKPDTETDLPVQQDPAHLQRLEQEKKLALLRQKLQSQRRSRIASQKQDVASHQATTEKPVLNVEVQQKSSILGGERVGSPTQMEVDEPNVQSTVMDPPQNLVMPKRPPVQARATLVRALTSAETTRPSTPSENGPKRGVKRPKADDFVEDNQPAKKSARLNGASNLPPLKRSSFAIANSAPPEQLIITWIDDDEVETPAPTPWNQSKDQAGINGARDSEAAQLAAAVMAIGLPMTAEELEAARLQEEERKAQLNAKAAKLHQIQANLKRLELKKAEKKLKVLQSAADQSAVLTEAVQMRNTVDTLKQQLEDIETKLATIRSATAEKTLQKETPPAENTTEVSTPDVPIIQEQNVEALLPEPSTDAALSDSPSSENEDWDMLKDDGENKTAFLLFPNLISVQN